MNPRIFYFPIDTIADSGKVSYQPKGKTMKIRPEHYAKMISAIRELSQKYPGLTPEHYASNGIGKDTAMRHRWDFLYRATVDGVPASRWICDELYPYANDTHIDTALRSIQSEIWLTH